MNHSIEYFEQQQGQLYKYMVGLTQNVLGLEKVFAELISLIQQFSRGLQGIGEKLHTQISDGNESDILVCCQQQVSNYLLRLSTNWDSIAQKIQSEVTEPYQQFVGNFRATNRSLNAETKLQLDEIKTARLAMSKQQEEYWKLMRIFEDSNMEIQMMADSIERGEKTKDDFQKKMNFSLRMQESAQEAERDYRKLIQITNEKWKLFFENWDRIFVNVGLNESSSVRVNFSKQTLLQMMKVLPTDLEVQLFEEKMQEIESKGKEKVEVKRLIEKRMESSGIQSKFQFEEFVPYEQYKLISQPALIGGQWQVVGSEDVTQQDKQLIDQYLHTLFVVDLSDKTEMIIQVKQALQKQGARSYFLDQIHRSHQKAIQDRSAQYYLNVSIEQFQELLQIIKSWVNFVDLNNCYDCEEIYNLLNKSIRIIKTEKKERISLASCLGELELWTKVDKWSELFFYISAKKVDEKKRQAESLIKQTENNIIKKGLGILGKGLQIFRKQQQQHLGVNENEISYLILEDINLFISSLRLSSDLSADIIFKIAFQQQHFDKDHVIKLLEKQEDLHNSQWKKKFRSGKAIHTYKIEKHEQLKLYQQEMKVIQVLKYTLKYLHPKDKPEKLLLLGSNFNRILKHKIAKYYMSLNFDLQKGRLSYISNILQMHKSQIDYIKMKVEIGIEIDINKQNYEETIALDVQRSLHIHKNKISTSVLQSLLRIYAYYNQEVGYCQGMNYIAGFLYLTYNDEIQAYKAFDCVMKLYFQEMYVEDFKKLKCAFYSFDRLLCIFLPELQQHLKDQKIDASYYAASWLITMYSNVFQYSIKSALLNIFWDTFLVEGWKGFYKSTFYIFSLIEKKLLELEFDEILHYLGRLIKDDLFQVDNNEELLKIVGTYEQVDPQRYDIKHQIKTRFRISNKMIKSLEQEYYCFQLNFTKKLSEYQKS